MSIENLGPSPYFRGLRRYANSRVARIQEQFGDNASGLFICSIPAHAKNAASKLSKGCSLGGSAVKTMLANILRLSAVIGLAVGISAETYWPTRQWREAKPETQGVDVPTLVQMLRYIRDQHIPIHSLLLVRHGYLVLDAWLYPYEPAWPHDLASATKSFSSALIGAAI